MKKTVFLMIIILAVLVSSYLVFAQNDKDNMMGNKMQKSEYMKKMMMCPLHMEMCKSMLSKQMVIADDGGVILLAGNKLMKYDKSLNLVSETELNIDMEQIQQKMQEMMSECPMYDKMMRNGKKTRNGQTPDSSQQRPMY